MIPTHLFLMYLPSKNQYCESLFCLLTKLTRSLNVRLRNFWWASFRIQKYLVAESITEYTVLWFAKKKHSSFYVFKLFSERCIFNNILLSFFFCKYVVFSTIVLKLLYTFIFIFTLSQWLNDSNNLTISTDQKMEKLNCDHHCDYVSIVGKSENRELCLCTVFSLGVFYY